MTQRYAVYTVVMANDGEPDLARVSMPATLARATREMREMERADGIQVYVVHGCGECREQGSQKEG